MLTTWQATWLCGGLIALTVVALTSLWYDLQARRFKPFKVQPELVPVVQRLILRRWFGRPVGFQVHETLGVAAVNTRGLRRLAVMMGETHRQQAATFEKTRALLEAQRDQLDQLERLEKPAPTQWERLLDDR